MKHTAQKLCRCSARPLVILLFHKIFSLFPFFFCQSSINLLHMFRDCTYFLFISIELNRPKLEENTWRNKCRLNEDFLCGGVFCSLPLSLSVCFLFFHWKKLQNEFTVVVCKTDLLNKSQSLSTSSFSITQIVYLFIYRIILSHW